MKRTQNSLIVLTVASALFVSLSSFLTEGGKPSIHVNKAVAPVASYTISLVSVVQSGTCYTWTWSVSNPNPGNGTNGTLQDISHWSMPLSTFAEAAFVSAQYSYDGANWTNASTTIDRDPSIKSCTGQDVLKFDIGTSGTAPTYYRLCLSGNFQTDGFAKSWIKTGGGQQGCNLYLFSGVGPQVN